jgi:hypothetical protein
LHSFGPKNHTLLFIQLPDSVLIGSRQTVQLDIEAKKAALLQPIFFKSGRQLV